jgi:hypothetical protein
MHPLQAHTSPCDYAPPVGALGLLLLGLRLLLPHGST